MTDAHCHISCGRGGVRELICGRDFIGIHPWDAEGVADIDAAIDGLRDRLAADRGLGVGEIGLDRLKSRDISPKMRKLFERQLALACWAGRPVVLHGAKCWGQVVKAVANSKVRLPCLFHGFSRSDGLIPEIVALGGYVSVGPAVLNDHAVNYRKLVRKIPLDRILVETDRTEANAGECPSIADVLAGLARELGIPLAELERITDENASRFL